MNDFWTNVLACVWMVTILGKYLFLECWSFLGRFTLLGVDVCLSLYRSPAAAMKTKIDGTCLHVLVMCVDMWSKGSIQHRFEPNQPIAFAPSWIVPSPLILSPQCPHNRTWYMQNTLYMHNATHQHRHIIAPHQNVIGLAHHSRMHSHNDVTIQFSSQCRPLNRNPPSSCSGRWHGSVQPRRTPRTSPISLCTTCCHSHHCCLFFSSILGCGGGLGGWKIVCSGFWCWMWCFNMGRGEGGGLGCGFEVFIGSVYWTSSACFKPWKLMPHQKRSNKTKAWKLEKKHRCWLWGLDLVVSNFKQRRPDNPTDPNKTLKNNKPKHHKNGTSNKQIKEDSLLVACGGCRKMCC